MTRNKTFSALAALALASHAAAYQCNWDIATPWSAGPYTTVSGSRLTIRPTNAAGSIPIITDWFEQAPPDPDRVILDPVRPDKTATEPERVILDPIRPDKTASVSLDPNGNAITNEGAQVKRGATMWRGKPMECAEAERCLLWNDFALACADYATSRFRDITNGTGNIDGPPESRIYTFTSNTATYNLGDIQPFPTGSVPSSGASFVIATVPVTNDVVATSSVAAAGAASNTASTIAATASPTGAAGTGTTATGSTLTSTTTSNSTAADGTSSPAGTPTTQDSGASGRSVQGWAPGALVVAYGLAIMVLV